VTFDADARQRAVDPSRNIVLEASAGTGKTRVLVERYVNLLLAGVEPEHILAITFTRKAAAEMRQRIVERLKEASRTSQLSAARWKTLRDRFGEIAISTIDAFCLSLIREFPLEADVDPGFDLADQTEIPRLIGEALDRALRIGRHLAQTDPDVAMVFVQLREHRLRDGLAALLGRRLVATDVLRRFLEFGPGDLTPEVACRRAAERLADVFAHTPGGLDALLNEGPTGHPQFEMLAADLSYRMGMIERVDVKRIKDLYIQAELPVVPPNLGAETYLRLMGLDKKVEGGKLRLVLLERIGDAVVRADVPPGMLIETLSLSESTAHA